MGSTEPAGGGVDIYTDGACSGNPGPGGWGVLLRYGRAERELYGGEPATTNNRMELMAAIRGIEAMTRPVEVRVHTDSTYLRDGITRWIHAWKANGWRTAGRKPVKNVDLWQRLETAIARHRVAWHWVRGHSGHPENERADALARKGMAPFLPESVGKRPASEAAAAPATAARARTRAGRAASPRRSPRSRRPPRG